MLDLVIAIDIWSNVVIDVVICDADAAGGTLSEPCSEGKEEEDEEEERIVLTGGHRVNATPMTCQRDSFHLR